MIGRAISRAAPGRAVVFAIALLSWAGHARANPADAFGYGARIPAMGGAGTSTTKDTEAGYYNPAGLGFFETIRFDLAWQYARPDLRINDEDLNVDSSRGAAFGLALPGRIGPIKAAVGLTWFLPDRYYLRTRALEGGQPRFQLYDNRPQRFLMSTNLGLSYKDRIAIGGGLTYMSGTEGDIKLRGRVGFPDADDSELKQGLDIDVRTVPYAQAGMLVKVSDRLTVGASYRGEFNLDIDLTLDVRGSIGARGQEAVVEDAYLSVRSQAQDLYQPAQYTIGAAFEVIDGLTIAADLGYYAWSGFENPATVIDIEIDAGEFNDDIDLMDTPPFPDPMYEDIIVPRVGIEWRALRVEGIDLDIRGGYSFEASPVPEQVAENNFVDNDKHTVSVGAGATFSKVTQIIPLPFSLDAYFAMTMLPERSHRKISPADPVGDFSSNGKILQFGLGSRWNF